MTQEKAFWLFVTFAVLVFAMGGGSRFDIESVGPLRGLAAIFLAVGLWYQTAEQRRSIAVPAALLLTLALWMAVQLVPLPSDWWQSLAGRDDIIALEELLGMEDQSRPITFSPLRTLNSLASLVVPLAALVLLSLLSGGSLRRLRQGVIIIGVVSALLGAAQLLLRGSDGLYFYEITNSDSAVGLFSNRNHNALLLNIALIFSLFWKGENARKSADQRVLMIWVSRLVLAVGILITSSRFGLVMLGIVGLVYAAGVLIDLRKSSAQVPLWQKIAGLAAVAGGAGLIALFALLGQIPALARFERFFAQGLADGQRTDTLPNVLQLASDHFPYGVGFGAFEQAFRTIEPEELLRPRYLNHAHNDWLQIVVEGGLPAVTILAIATIWLASAAWSNFQYRRAEGRSMSGLALGLLTLGLVILHSTVDYPLRTPSIMLVAAYAVLLVVRKPANASA